MAQCNTTQHNATHTKEMAHCIGSGAHVRARQKATQRRWARRARQDSCRHTQKRMHMHGQEVAQRMEEARSKAEFRIAHGITKEEYESIIDEAFRHMQRPR